MLELLRNSNKCYSIVLTEDFHRNLNWFCKFVSKFNGLAFFVYKNVNYEIELDACLQGLGARCGNLLNSIASGSQKHEDRASGDAEYSSCY